MASFSLQMWKVREEEEALSYDKRSNSPLAINTSLFLLNIIMVDSLNGKDNLHHVGVQEINYLQIVGMAAQSGWMNVRYLYSKRVGFELKTNAIKLEYDSDAKSLGKYIDINRVVDLYCEGYHNDDDRVEKEISSSDDEGNWSGEGEEVSDKNMSDFVDSDGEDIGKEGDMLIDVGIDFGGGLGVILI